MYNYHLFSLELLTTPHNLIECDGTGFKVYEILPYILQWYSNVNLKCHYKMLMNLVRFVTCTFVSRVHMTFYILTKGNTVPENQGTRDELYQIRVDFIWNMKTFFFLILGDSRLKKTQIFWWSLVILIFHTRTKFSDRKSFKTS